MNTRTLFFLSLVALLSTSAIATEDDGDLPDPDVLLEAPHDPSNPFLSGHPGDGNHGPGEDTGNPDGPAPHHGGLPGFGGLGKPGGGGLDSMFKHAFGQLFHHHPVKGSVPPHHGPLHGMIPEDPARGHPPPGNHGPPPITGDNGPPKGLFGKPFPGSHLPPHQPAPPHGGALGNLLHGLFGNPAGKAAPPLFGQPNHGSGPTPPPNGPLLGAGGHDRLHHSDDPFGHDDNSPPEPMSPFGDHSSGSGSGRGSGSGSGSGPHIPPPMPHLGGGDHGRPKGLHLAGSNPFEHHPNTNNNPFAPHHNPLPLPHFPPPPGHHPAGLGQRARDRMKQEEAKEKKAEQDAEKQAKAAEEDEKRQEAKLKKEEAEQKAEEKKEKEEDRRAEKKMEKEQAKQQEEMHKEQQRIHHDLMHGGGGGSPFGHHHGIMPPPSHGAGDPNHPHPLGDEAAANAKNSERADHRLANMLKNELHAQHPDKPIGGPLQHSHFMPRLPHIPHGSLFGPQHHKNENEKPFGPFHPPPGARGHSPFHVPGGGKSLFRHPEPNPFEHHGGNPFGHHTLGGNPFEHKLGGNPFGRPKKGRDMLKPLGGENPFGPTHKNKNPFGGLPLLSRYRYTPCWTVGPALRRRSVVCKCGMSGV